MNGQEKKPLVDVLSYLEQTFNIKFSFLDDNVSELKVTVPSEDIQLGLILQSIEEETQLKITKLNDRYYSLSLNYTISICGNIIDENSSFPVFGANIEILGSSIGVVSNYSGAFELNNIPRKAIVKISHLGYNTLYFSAENLGVTPCKTIYLLPEYEQLEEVVVLQLLTSGISKHIDGGIIMTTENFGILPGLSEPDVLQSLQSLPGIKSVDENVSDINIRGGTNDQNLILWDGIKMYQSGHFFGLISAFNPYLTQSVKVIKNGTTAQYGDGVSGTLSMMTKNELKTDFFGGAGFNLIEADAFGQIPINERLGVQFSARRSYTDLINTFMYGQFSDKVFQDSKITNSNNEEIDNTTTDNQSFHFYDYTAKLMYDFNEDHSLRVHFLNTFNTLDYQETSTENDGSSETSNSNLDEENIAFGIRVKNQWFNNFKSEVNAYYTQYNLNARDETLNSNQILNQTNEVIETSVKLATFWNLNEQLQWLNGYQFTETGIRNFTNINLPSFTSNVKDVMRTHAAFSEIDYTSKNEKLNTALGARLNYYINLDNTQGGSFESFIIEPRVNINYKITPKLTLEVLGEYKSQVTNQVTDLEQNFLGIVRKRWILSDNESIPITKSQQVSLGINYNIHTLFISLEGFYKKVNGITTATQGFLNEDLFDTDYLGEYTNNGFEFLINNKTGKYSTWLSYTLNNNNYKFENLTPIEFPNNLDIKHNLTLATTYTHKNFKIGMGMHWRTGIPYTEPNADDPINTDVQPNTINYNEINSSRLPDYFRADFSSTYDFSMGKDLKAQVGVSLLNFLNKENTLNIYYEFDDASNDIEKIERISLGITPNVSFRVNF